MSQSLFWSKNPIVWYGSSLNPNVLSCKDEDPDIFKVTSSNLKSEYFGVGIRGIENYKMYLAFYNIPLFPSFHLKLWDFPVTLSKDSQVRNYFYNNKEIQFQTSFLSFELAISIIFWLKDEDIFALFNDQIFLRNVVRFLSIVSPLLKLLTFSLHKICTIIGLLITSV